MRAASASGGFHPATFPAGGRGKEDNRGCVVRMGDAAVREAFL